MRYVSLFSVLLMMAGQVSAQPAAPSAGGEATASTGQFRLVVLHAGPPPAAERHIAPSLGAKSLSSGTMRKRDVHARRRRNFLPKVMEAEQRLALPKGLLDALIWTESRYDTFATSKAGAVGLGQLMPRTAKELGVKNRMEPQGNLWAAARYLRQMIDKFGTIHLALAAYNAGPGRVEAARGIPQNQETPHYVRTVLNNWKRFASQYNAMPEVGE